MTVKLKKLKIVGKIVIYLFCCCILVILIFKEKFYSIIRGEDLDCHRVQEIQADGCDTIDVYETSPN